MQANCEGQNIRFIGMGGISWTLTLANLVIGIAFYSLGRLSSRTSDFELVLVTILFRLDTWIGDRPLANQYPTLFQCVTDPYAKANSYVDRGGSIVIWGPILRRNLTEEEEVCQLLHAIASVYIPMAGVDWRVWMGTSVGSFLAASLFKITAVEGYYFCFGGASWGHPHLG